MKSTNLAGAVLKANARLRKTMDAYLVGQAGWHRPRDIEAGVRLLADQARNDGVGGIITPSYIRGFLIAGPAEGRGTRP